MLLPPKGGIRPKHWSHAHSCIDYAGVKGRRIRELTSVVQKRFKFPEGSVELYAEKVGRMAGWLDAGRHSLGAPEDGRHQAAAAAAACGCHASLDAAAKWWQRCGCAYVKG